MGINIQNVLSKKKEPLKLVDENIVKIYVCGVTVYGRCHVGHLRCYLSFDAIMRYLKYRGYDVHYVRNFTDIDDKIIARAREITAGPDGDWRKGAAYTDYDDAQWELRLAEDAEILRRSKGSNRHLAEVVSDYFIDVFKKEDFGPFDLFPAQQEPRVSEHIPEVIELIEKIIQRGFAYESDGDVYFDVPAYHKATGAYGKLSGRDFTQMLDGARVSASDKKRSGVDFALWKSSREGEPAWCSPWGQGRPGWHIECSAMSIKELGQPFDIHGGGKDLIFPHHENEIAQTEAATGAPFCNTWMHNGFVTVDGVKMSKSLGNFIAISEALEMAPPEVWRYVVLGTHYANPIDFSCTRETGEGDELCIVRGTIDIAFDRIVYLYETLARAEEVLGRIDVTDDAPVLDDSRVAKVIDGFVASMDDDFNTAKAVACLAEALKYVNELCDLKAKQIKKLVGGKPSYAKTLQKLKMDILEICAVMGLAQKTPSVALVELRDFMVGLKKLDKGMILQKLEERVQARADKDFARSDEIRDELLAMGVELRDGPQGTDWKVLR